MCADSVCDAVIELWAGCEKNPMELDTTAEKVCGGLGDRSSGTPETVVADFRM